MSVSARYGEALLWAEQIHRDQRRKGKAIPYISHLISVSALVWEDGGIEDQAIAALLHDAIEDAGQSHASIAERFGSAVADIVRMREAEVDEKRPRVVFAFARAEVIEHAFGMPSATSFRRAAAFGGIMNDIKQIVRRWVAVSLFASAHGGVSSTTEDRTDAVFFQFGRTCFRSGADGEVPDRATTQDHVSRGRADRPGESPHVMGGIDDHALRRECSEMRGLQSGLTIIKAKIKRRLVIGEDEENVRLARFRSVRQHG
jgi:hypothetical protein